MSNHTCENFMVATNIRANYVYQGNSTPILLECRKGFRKSALFTVINGEACSIESGTQNILLDLARRIPQGAAITISHRVDLEANGILHEVDILESLLRGEESKSASELGVQISLICIVEQRSYKTQPHDDVYEAFDELVNLLSSQNNIVLHICPFCEYADFHAHCLFCLRDAAPENLAAIRTLGKHAENANWYHGGIWGLDEFHTCVSFKKCSVRIF